MPSKVPLWFGVLVICLALIGAGGAIANYEHYRALEIPVGSASGGGIISEVAPTVTNATIYEIIPGDTFHKQLANAMDFCLERQFSNTEHLEISDGQWVGDCQSLLAYVTGVLDVWSRNDVATFGPKSPAVTGRNNTINIK